MDTKALRQKILDLAVRGKLVPQNPDDEPARVLLERIRAEKKQMVKDGRLKAKDIKNDSVIYFKEDNLPYEQFADGTEKCITDEIPFELPHGWEWTRIGFLGQYKKGPFGSSITKAMFVPDSPNAIKVYEQKNAIQKSSDIGNYFITQEKFESLKGFEIFPNDIIVSCAGTIGETFIMPLSMRKGIINQALMKITLYDLNLIPYYLMYFDVVLKNSAKEQGHGIALKNIPSFDILKQYLIPVPPLSEQKRIADKINELMGLVDVIEQNKTDLQTAVKLAKEKILDLAIRGQLVPQNPDDEPASVLLERIRAEKQQLIQQGKIKPDKKDTVTFTDDELPFELPDGWEWTKLSNIANIIMGSSPSGKAVCDNPKYTEFHQGKIYFSEKNIKSSGQFTKEISKIAPANSVLLCVRAPVGEVNITDRIICIGRGLASVSLFINSSEEFLFYWLKAFKNDMVSKATGTTFVAITADVVKNLLVPIPPLNEQKRIADKINQLFSMLDSITEFLN